MTQEAMEEYDELNDTPEGRFFKAVSSGESDANYMVFEFKILDGDHPRLKELEEWILCHPWPE